MSQLKPGDRAFIVRRANSPFFGCMNCCIGHPVKVARISGIASGDGFVWSLEEGPRCPERSPFCEGVREAPDRCLEPFKDLPADDDTDTTDGKPVDRPATVE